MREGILIPDMQTGRVDIRFNSDDCYRGLHCDTTMDIWLNEQWIPTRIEMNSSGTWSAFRSRRCGASGYASAGDQTAIRSKAGCRAVSLAETIPVS